jgi:hypothetical protein
MITIDPTTQYILVEQPRPVMEFGTDNRKTSESGKPLTSYIVQTIGKGDSLPRITVKAPDAPVTPGQFVKFDGLRVNLWTPEKAKYHALSFAANAVEAASK